MSAGNCPECGNLTAYSAKKCPSCGNRNFYIRTKSFIDVCGQCNGAGEIYSHPNYRLESQSCPSCGGQGYLTRSYDVDCRNTSEADRVFAIAEQKRRENKAIKEAIATQTMCQTFFDRGGRLREDERHSANLKLWTDKHFDFLRRRDRARETAKTYIGRGVKLAFVAWLVVGFVGCFSRGMNYTTSTKYGGDYDAYAKGLWSTQLTSYTKEGLVAAVLVFGLACLIAVLTVWEAEKALRRVGGMPTREGTN